VAENNAQLCSWYAAQKGGLKTEEKETGKKCGWNFPKKSNAKKNLKFFGLKNNLRKHCTDRPNLRRRGAWTGAADPMPENKIKALLDFPGLKWLLRTLLGV